MIVFDTCALLNLYNLSDESLGKVVSFLENKKNSIFLPFQVYHEFCARYKEVRGRASASLKKSKEDIEKLMQQIAADYGKVLGYFKQYDSDLLNIVEQVKINHQKNQDSIQAEVDKIVANNTKTIDDTTDLVLKFVQTIVEILKPFENCRVYDPCCGSGGMFVQSAKFIKAHSGKRGVASVSVYGQESNADTWKMAKMNMAIRGIDANFGEYQADTFFNDLHPTLKADFIMANPPFNLSNWGQDKLQDDIRWRYGIPPAGNANFAWIQHMIHHLAPNGKIGLVLANGALSSQSSGEGEIRKRIVEDDLIEGIVALPSQLFYSVTIPVTLWFISKNKKQKGKTVFIDARKMGYMIDRKHRDFTDADIAKIANTFEAFQNGTLQDVKGFCAVKTIQDIETQDYILSPGRYVGIEEQVEDDEPFDEKMTRLTTELSQMFAKSHELEEEIRKKLRAIGYEI